MTPAELHDLLSTSTFHALLDVREYGEHNEGHIAGSSPLPRRLLELRASALVPYRGTRAVVYDDGSGRAGLAAATLRHMGYSMVDVLEGGTDGWSAAGFPLEWGSNVPSKEFGERVLVEDAVPEIEPADLHRLQQSGEPFLLLDARTPEEHGQACIPGSRSMPGVELALRAQALGVRPDSRIVVHCAGRTRSIIGAQTLRLLGFRNVTALKNGTMGWHLAGLELETGSPRTGLVAPSPEQVQEAEAGAVRLAAQAGVRFLDAAGLRAMLGRAAVENVYLIDVRTREEYTAGHLPGSQWMAGGQAVQRSDETVAVRHGQIVFVCDGVVRAAVTAYWYRRLGFPNVYALAGGVAAARRAGMELVEGAPDGEPFGYEAARTAVGLVSPQQAAGILETCMILHTGTSREYTAAHLPGSSWLSRSWLELRIGGLAPAFEQPILLTCADGVQSTLAGAALQGLGYADVSVLEGGVAAWRDTGLPIETGLMRPITPANDAVLAGTERTREAMVHYLAWEEELGKKYEKGARS